MCGNTAREAEKRDAYKVYGDKTRREEITWNV
jgi:hypothetical protein